MKLCRFSLGIPLLVCSVLLSGLVAGNNVIEEIDSNALHTIEGRVYQPEFLSTDFNWQHDTSISINGGEFKGFLREDGTFVVSGIPSGSYLVEIENPDYIYESVSLFILLDLIPRYKYYFVSSLQVRVEINPKGKFRARKVNLVQPAQVIQVPYPLKLKAANRFKYFQTREQWKVRDYSNIRRTNRHLYTKRISF